MAPKKKLRKFEGLWEEDDSERQWDARYGDEEKDFADY